MTMAEPKRLFDCLSMHLDKEPLPDMLSGKENGKWKSYSSKEVAEIIHKLSTGLLRSDVSGEDRTVAGMDKVAIVAKNLPEWIMLDLQVQQTGAVLAPIYPTISVGELEFILNDAQVKVIFVNDEELYHKVLSIRNRVPLLRAIYTFEHVVNATYWKDLLVTATPEEEVQLAAIRDNIHEDD